MTQNKSVSTRLTIAGAGIFGGGGVMAAAGAAHGGSGNLSAIALICLAHGPALLALGLSRWRGRLFRLAALLLGVGTLVFCGDLLARDYLGHSAFAFAAPIGGLGMICGWAAVIAGGVLSTDPTNNL